MSITTNLSENTNVWESLGPVASGGTVFGLAISPTEDVPRIWAATGCGIFSSDDGGQSWRQTLAGLTTPLLSTLDVGPTGALFAGALGGDIFSSFNYGSTWEPGLVPEELKSTVTMIVVSPNFQKDGTAFAATDGGGLLVSRNSGSQWEDSSFGLGDPSVLALAATPDWSRDEILFAATTEGVFISRNGGRAWRETDLMLSDDIVDVLAVSPAFDEDGTVYAGTEGGCLYVSRNGGRRWEPLVGKIGDGPVNCLWVASDQDGGSRFVAGVGSEIHLSRDGGETWSMTHQMPGSVLAVCGNQEVVLAGMHDAGVWKSSDGGETWAPVEGFASRGFARLLSAGDKLIAMGPQEGMWISEDRAQSWRDLPGLMPHLPIAAISAPSEGNYFVSSQEAGILRSVDGGESWSKVSERPGVQTILVLPEEGKGWAGSVDGQILYSEDGGSTWAEAESPCPGQEVLAIVASPTFDQDHTLFMGTATATTGNQQGRVALWRSTNGGETWRQLTTQVTDARWVDIVMPGDGTENAADQAVVATGPYCLRPLRRAKDVWISTRVDASGANTLSVVALGEIDKGGELYAATGNGIFRSGDGGRTWQPFSSGLTAGSFVTVVAVSAEGTRELYALSLGGMVWKRELD